jgi:hypothetical protein
MPVSNGEAINYNKADIVVGIRIGSNRTQDGVRKTDTKYRRREAELIWLPKEG